MTAVMKIKRGKTALILLLAAIGCTAVLLSTGFLSTVNRNNRAFSRTVKKWVQQAREGDRISLSELTPFSWDAVYTFDPYTSREEMEQALGFSSKDFRETVSEGMVQLIFVDYGDSAGTGKVVCSICGYDGNLGYFVDLGGRADRRSSFTSLNPSGDQMTLRIRENCPGLVFEEEIRY